MKKYKMIGALLIVAGVAVIIFVLYHNSQKRQQALVYSPRFMLGALWSSYKKQYWDSGSGRTIDHQRNDVTTSEGQSYTMLRAVWQDDRTTFDKTWQWTENNMKRPNDELFSWLYGKRSDGSYGILSDQGGQNTATDADTDIALALIFASKRWNEPAYLKQAQATITDIWNNEVIISGGKPYIAADNLEKNSLTTFLVNPSYFAPYAYRIFAQLDPSHDWNGAVATSYEILQKTAGATLDKTTSDGLPPDWLLVSKSDQNISATGNSELTTNYGFDAIRTPFRIALDFRWNGDPAAKAFLDKLSFLGQQWQIMGRLASTYGHDGNITSEDESPAMYGGSLGYFLISRPDLASDVYKNKLLTLYSPDKQDWKKELSYYDDNWAWFGMALDNGLLIDLYSGE